MYRWAIHSPFYRFGQQASIDRPFHDSNVSDDNHFTILLLFLFPTIAADVNTYPLLELTMQFDLYTTPNTFKTNTNNPFWGGQRSAITDHPEEMVTERS